MSSKYTSHLKDFFVTGFRIVGYTAIAVELLLGIGLAKNRYDQSHPPPGLEITATCSNVERREHNSKRREDSIVLYLERGEVKPIGNVKGEFPPEEIHGKTLSIDKPWNWRQGYPGPLSVDDLEQRATNMGRVSFKIPIGAYHNGSYVCWDDNVEFLR